MTLATTGVIKKEFGKSILLQYCCYAYILLGGGPTNSWQSVYSHRDQNSTELVLLQGEGKRTKTFIVQWGDFQTKIYGTFPCNQSAFPEFILFSKNSHSATFEFFPLSSFTANAAS